MDFTWDTWVDTRSDRLSDLTVKSCFFQWCSSVSFSFFFFFDRLYYTTYYQSTENNSGCCVCMLECPSSFSQKYEKLLPLRKSCRNPLVFWPHLTAVTATILEGSASNIWNHCTDRVQILYLGVRMYVAVMHSEAAQ